jgi:signal transduction histidine kinase
MLKTMKTFAPNPVLEKRIFNSMYATGALLVLDVIFFEDYVSFLFWHVAQLTLIIISFKVREFALARRVMLGIVPLLFLLFVSNLIETLWNDVFVVIDNYIDLGYAIAITWLISKIISSNKQTKALIIGRKERLVEREKRQFLEDQRIQLEKLVAERTAELTHQKEELQNTLIELQSTQRQLIQSEKMASLGELTAGIAHEIQNPLNFVNNFAEVNSELFTEMKEAVKTNDGFAVEVLTKDIEQNLKMIAHHGKRADAIVKGMLQHSRISTGQKEPTDINALADEYLRLSYHGLRAKDKTFNAIYKTNFDENLGNIEVIPQDLGRVLLNLYNNAFYSVNQKKKLQGQAFDPHVRVTTKKITPFPSGTHRANSPGIHSAGRGAGWWAEIIVRDNGMGIPKETIDKIYQPFFTTKPTGQGTGLGLSICYEIITKGHGGELKANTVEGEFAEFIIQLPQ